jgi:hypothetical protein
MVIEKCKTLPLMIWMARILVDKPFSRGLAQMDSDQSGEPRLTRDPSALLTVLPIHARMAVNGTTRCGFAVTDVRMMKVWQVVKGHNVRQNRLRMPFAPAYIVCELMMGVGVPRSAKYFRIRLTAW